MAKGELAGIQSGLFLKNGVLNARKKKAKKITSIISEESQFNVMMSSPIAIQRELNNRSFYNFFLYFWDTITQAKLVPNWHLSYLCAEVQEAVERVALGLPCENDILINIPPGTTKTTLLSIMLNAWIWTKWEWFQVIGASYSLQLSLKSASTTRDLIRSQKFKEMYPELYIKADEDSKSDFRIMKKSNVEKEEDIRGGFRFSTSVGGTVTGMHGHLIIIDDPLNPLQALSPQLLNTTNHWVNSVIPTRKVDKDVTLTIMVMQRLHENDPSGNWLAKEKIRAKTNSHDRGLKHICLPADISESKEFLKPQEVGIYYRQNLLDPERLSKGVLNQMLADLGNYQYSGQFLQNPVSSKGGMFKVDFLQIINNPPLPHEIEFTVRYWDKAGTAGGGAYTAGTRMSKLKDGRFLISDVKRGQWGTDERERMIKAVANADGKSVHIGLEQEPGSGGKESAEATIRNLAGYNVTKDLPRGDKVLRADPFSVQVNYGNVLLLRGDWNEPYINEMRNFPLSKYKDQIDSSSGAFNMLTSKRKARVK